MFCQNDKRYIIHDESKFLVNKRAEHKHSPSVPTLALIVWTALPSGDSAVPCDAPLALVLTFSGPSPDHNQFSGLVVAALCSAAI